MLVYQAVAAAELFTGKKVNDTDCEHTIEETRRELENIVLIGMPGSGKSSVGQSISARLRREFIDLDTCVIKKAGMSIPEIFDRHGESLFRELESECAEEMSKRSGVVIATGGGIVLKQSNMRVLKHNGRIYYLDRPIDKLPTDGRPLSTSENALNRIYAVRHPLYTEYSDNCIDCSNTVDAAVKAIEEDFLF